MADPGSTSGLPRAAFDAAARGPLHGMRVLDLSRLVAGNMLTLQLADLGADVVKVEPVAEGDTLRQWTQPHPDHPGGFDGWWQVYARNKRSIALNLRSPQAIELLRRLCERADVLVESFRPGTLEAMGLAPQVLHAGNARLIVARLSGWGQTGPYKDLPGFGSLIEGFSGYAMKGGDSPAAPPELPGIALADMVAGLNGAFAVMTALREVEVNGGAGQVIDLSLLEPMLSIMGPDVTNYARTGGQPQRGRKIASPRGVYRCRDGHWVALSGSTDAMARKVFGAIGAADLLESDRFRTNAARLEHDGEIEALIQAYIGRLDRQACLAHFRAHGVTVGPIHDAPGIYADEHVRGRGVYVAARPAEDAADVVMHAAVPRMSATPGRLRHPAPRHGQHTRDILSELGLSGERLRELHDQGHIKCS